MKITTLTRRYEDETVRKLSEKTKRRIENAAIRLRRAGYDIEIDWVYYEDDPIVTGDVLWVRSIGKYRNECTLIVRQCIHDGIPVVDRYISDMVNRGMTARPNSKELMINKLNAHGIPVPDTRVVTVGWADAETYMGKVVRKSRGGRRGLGTYYVRTEEHLDQMIMELDPGQRVLVSPYIENDGDYRVVVVGGTAIGQFRRGLKDLSLLTLSSSLDAEDCAVNEDVNRLAERACEALKIDIASLDIVVDSVTGQCVVIEVNECPSWHAFDKRVFGNRRGVPKTADAILEMLMNVINISE